jgi:hypothetical protein
MTARIRLRGTFACPRHEATWEWRLILTVFLLLVSTTHAAEPPQPDFDTHIAPLLAARCLNCHSGSEPKGRLDLTSFSRAIKGGENGPALVPGKLDDSPLWTRVNDGDMPPEHPLPDSEKLLLREWIAAGAVWGTDPIDALKYTTSNRAGYDWWSFQPLKAVAPPPVSKNDWPRNDIDRFILNRLEQEGLSPSAQASPRIRLRRVFIDLTGLPPTPEAVAKFEADPSPEAYAAVVDELLASPQYGERWGRHWLDVARFGESNGFERNDPRDNFWPYRDWVIDALNTDMPYAEFARAQIAGDLQSGGLDGASAVGFLVAGVHNTVVGSSERMRRLARQDELEEIAGAVGQAFLGLTINCARCHDHKFDPIRTEEYYRFISALDGIQHGERLEGPNADREKLESLERKSRSLQKKIARIDRAARQRVARTRNPVSDPDDPAAPIPFATWDFEDTLSDSQGRWPVEAHGSARLENGALVLDGKDAWVSTAPLNVDFEEKTLEAWIALENVNQRGGAAISIETPDGGQFDAIVFGEIEPRRWMAGSEGFVRTRSFQGGDEDADVTRAVHIAITYDRDGRITAYRDGKPYGTAYQTGFNVFRAGRSRIVFGLRHFPVAESKLLAGRILKASIYAEALDAKAIAASARLGGDAVTENSLLAALTDEERLAREEMIRQLDIHSKSRRELESHRRKVYTVTPADPGEMPVHLRGGVTDFGPVVTPGGVQSVTGASADFQLPAKATDRQRRLKLAEWITVSARPLFSRVIVNRLWQHHFGSGLVETPSDFGFNGGKPTHPELLDWLAGQLARNGDRLKPLHRLIVTSAAHQQESRSNPQGLAKDASSRLLWRYPAMRTDAESLRDAILQAAGVLDLKRGGPGYRDVVFNNFNGTTFYIPMDEDNPAFHRRTIYRFVPRGGINPVLETFDCPDPSVTAPQRSVTTTPLQALSLLNNAFILTMSDRLAARVSSEVKDDAAGQVRRMWNLCLCRDPEADEAAEAETLVKSHGLAALARALFNANEFVVIE